MAWDVEGTDEFAAWFGALTAEERIKVSATIDLLADRGISLDHPHSSAIQGSRHGHMRELRIQVHGRPFRVLYAFDPRRTAILLIGGDKTGNERWYEQFIPVADDLYDAYLDELRREGAL